MRLCALLGGALLLAALPAAARPDLTADAVSRATTLNPVIGEVASLFDGHTLEDDPAAGSVEWGGAGQLTLQGLTRTTVKYGDVLAITANPSRTPDDHKLHMVTLKRASDGFGWGSRPGEVGALLRREGLYSSHLTAWRAARDRGELAGAAKKRGPVPQGPDPRGKRIIELERETTRWQKRAERAEALVEVPKKLAALLGTPLEGETL